MEKLDHVADTQQRGWQPRQSLGPWKTLAATRDARTGVAATSETTSLHGLLEAPLLTAGCFRTQPGRHCLAHPGDGDHAHDSQLFCVSETLGSTPDTRTPPMNPLLRLLISEFLLEAKPT